MKKLFTILLFLLPTLLLGQQSPPTFVNTVANDGQNAITYKSFKINDYASNGGQAEYNPHPGNSAGFDAMFDYANKNTTTWTHQGRDTATKAFTWPWSNILPRHDNSNFGWIIEGYFVPPTSGTYKFQLISDDRSDFWFDANDDGTITNSGMSMGNGARDVDVTNLTAGVSYKFRVRYEQGAGGANLYLRWKSPEDVEAGASFAFNSNSIWSIDVDNYVEPINYNLNFDFGPSITPTNFSVNTHYKVSEQQTSLNPNSNSINLNSNGEVTIDSQIDETLTSDGTNKIRAIPDAGGIATVLGSNQYGTGNMRFYIDNRMFDAGFDFGSISSVEILDIYTGPMIFQNTDPSSIWQFYKIEGLTLTRAIVAQSQYYLPNGWASTGIYEMNPQNNYTYPDFVVTNDWEVIPNQNYKEQYVVFDSPSNLQLLMDDIITVSDVYIAFKELTNSGLGMNESGNEFIYGIQYSNSDLDRNGVFNFEDTFMMMDFLNGGTLFDTSYLAATMKLIDTNTYNSISSTNWNTHTTKTIYPLGLINGTMDYNTNVSVSWMGDVNFSHSPTPTNNLSITGKTFKSRIKKEGEITSILKTEIKDTDIIVTLTLDEVGTDIMGTQFRLHYDNSLLTFNKFETNSIGNSFGNDRGEYINFGSLITNDNGNLTNNTEYKITLKNPTSVKDILGLFAITKTEAVNKGGTQLNVVIK